MKIIVNIKMHLSFSFFLFLFFPPYSLLHSLYRGSDRTMIQIRIHVYKLCRAGSNDLINTPHHIG